MRGQLASEIETGDGTPGLVVSASKELEPNARAALLLADGLFRLDVAVAGDTIRTIVRNLSAGRLQMADGAEGQAVRGVACGDVEAYQPGATGMRFWLGEGSDLVSVAVLLGVVQVPDRGTVRVSGQAVLRLGSAIASAVSAGSGGSPASSARAT